MGVTALAMDVITEKSGHQVTPCAVSVCTTPAAPSPLPIPYPVLATAAEGLSDTALRTKVTGSPVATVGSVFKGCHGNEPGTLKEVVSLNTAGPCFIIMGAPVVLCELGMMGITGSACISNKAPTPGANGTASGAGGAGGAGGGAGGGGAAPDGPGGPSGPSNGGGGGGGSNSGAGGGAAGPGGRASGADAPPGTSSGAPEQHQCQGGHPIDLVTGYVVDAATDLSLPGRIPWSFRRVYSSGRANDRAASLGAGWAHGLDQHVRVEGDNVTMRDAQGRDVYFGAVAIGESTFHRRERLSLYRDGASDYRVYDHRARTTTGFRPLVANGVSSPTETVDAWGNTIRYEHVDGRLTSVTDTAGRVIAVRWQRGRICRIEVTSGGAPEVWVDYEYDDAGLLVAVTDALGFTDELEYDGHGRMIATTTRLGVRFQYEYDKDTGRCKKTWGPNGLYAIELEYDDVKRTTHVYGEESRLIEWDDLPGFARRESTLDGKVLEERAYDSDGYLIATANGAGEGPKSWFDARGNEIRRVDATGLATTWEYDDRDCLRRRVDPDGTHVEYSVDDRGSVLSVRERSGRLVQLTHDGFGRLERADDEGGVVRSWVYDSQHNLIAETDARGARISYAFDALGRAVQYTDALGRTTRATRDHLGRATTLTLADGAVVQRSYDAQGNVLREVTPEGGVTSRTYAGMGVLSRLVGKDGRTWSFTYTSQERLSKITNPLGESYAFEYDEAGRVIKEKTFDNRALRYLRSASGRVDRIEYEDGTFRTFEYDRAGRLRADEGSDGSRASFGRDAAGRLLEATLVEADSRHSVLFERDELGRVVVERQADWQLQYAYDAKNMRIERKLFDGTTTRYAYDREGALSELEHAGKRFSFERDQTGRERTWQDGRGTFKLETSYDERDRITEQRALGPTGADGVPNVLLARKYEFDAAGRATRVTDVNAGISENTYDRAGSLTHARVADHRFAFVYDSARSLIDSLDGLAGASHRRWKVAPGNRLLETDRTTFGYDKRGRRTEAVDKASKGSTRYVWDLRDRLREVQNPDGSRTRFSYDALGRRVRSEHWAKGAVRARVTGFVWDGDSVCADLPETGQLRSFVHHPERMRLLLQAERGEVFAVVSDHLAIPKELIDGEGRVAWAGEHDPWGRLVRERGDETSARTRGYQVRCPFRLMGQYADEDTGLAVSRFRYFDPTVGRWLSPDPVGVRGGFDLFGFNGAPTVDVDPLGLTGPAHESAPSRGAAMRRAQEHAQVPRESRGGEPIPVGELRDSSRGRNANAIAEAGGNLGRRDPHSSASVMDHPDGHPDAGQPGVPAHHGSPHVHAVDRNGNELVITYPSPT